MLVIHGTSLYGKVDQVKGLFHVATLFFYVNWVPIIPRASYLVLENAGEKAGSRGIRIRMSGKSILLAWGRCALLLGGCLVVPLLCLTARDAGPHLVLAALACPIVSLFGLFMSYRFTRAGAERALELADLAGIPPHVLADFFADRLTPEEEDRLRNLAAEQVDASQNPS